MPLGIGDLRFHYSGGATNEDPNASLGGIISSAAGAVVVSQGIGNQPTNVTGVTIYDAYGNPYGDGTLSYYSANDAFTWTSLGGTESAEVISTGAEYCTVGDNAGGYIYLYTTGIYPVADVSDTIAITAASNKTYDNIGFIDAETGDTEYRCFYIKNTASGSIVDVSIWIGSQPSGADSLEIGLDSAGKGDGATTGVATTIANEDAVPSGVTFSTPSSGTPLTVGTLDAGEAYALWMKRIVPSSTTTMELFDTSDLVVQAFI